MLIQTQVDTCRGRGTIRGGAPRGPAAAHFGIVQIIRTRDIWLAIVCGHFTRATLSVLRFRQGAWRNIKVTAPA